MPAKRSHSGWRTTSLGAEFHDHDRTMAMTQSAVVDRKARGTRDYYLLLT
jgi:hypothetical protein